jgi:hypothetical protein
MVDDRVRHFWDGHRLLGAHFAKVTGAEAGAVAWDVFFLYAPDASWGDQPQASGAPVVVKAARLQSALEPYLSEE